MSSYGNNFKASSVEVDVLKTRERFCTFGVAPATAYSVGVVGDVRYVRTGVQDIFTSALQRMSGAEQQLLVGARNFNSILIIKE